MASDAAGSLRRSPPGAAAAFAISLNEATVTLFLATPTTETMPAVAWAQLRYSPSPLVAVASCVSVAVGGIVAAVVAAAWSRWKRPD
ncbi:MAG: hypothetical protein U0736_20920 [Gemmataceae bacterium]